MFASRTGARGTVELVTSLLLATSVTEKKPSSQRRPRCRGASSVSVHLNPSVSDGDSGTITRPQNARVLPNSVPLCLCASVAKKRPRRTGPEAHDRVTGFGCGYAAHCPSGLRPSRRARRARARRSRQVSSSTAAKFQCPASESHTLPRLAFEARAESRARTFRIRGSG